MMRYGGYGSGAVYSSWSFFGILTWAVILVDLVLLGVWFWKQINKK